MIEQEPCRVARNSWACLALVQSKVLICRVLRIDRTLRRLALSTDRLGLRAEVEDSVRLLPLFDCYVRGCHPRDSLIPPWAQRAVVQGGIGQIPDLLIDGVVAGVWEQRRRGDRVEVTVEPFLRLTAHQRVLLEGEAARIGEVQEAEATLTVGPVAARPHL